MIRPQVWWVQIALSGGIRLERQLHIRRGFLWATWRLRGGCSRFMCIPSLNFLVDVEKWFRDRILKWDPPNLRPYQLDSNLQNFLDSIAYIIPRITVSCQTPDDVVNKQRNMSNFSIHKWKYIIKKAWIVSLPQVVSFAFKIIVGWFRPPFAESRLPTPIKYPELFKFLIDSIYMKNWM